MAGAALLQRAGSAGEYGFDALQVGNFEPARLVISLKALYAIQANALNQVNAVFNGISAQLPIAAGAGGVDVEHVEFQVRCRATGTVMTGVNSAAGQVVALADKRASAAYAGLTFVTNSNVPVKG
ncbi:hypothetical protein KPSB59_2750003 [Klebsiella quasipneumoniae subsp. quasipneumoniae]|nr:hypothetical protein KPSB59_2750003 [Klebsiella quasipneumoniae subsp. quasipneumoniae]